MKTLGRKLDTNLKRDELRRDEGGYHILVPISKLYTIKYIYNP